MEVATDLGRLQKWRLRQTWCWRLLLPSRNPHMLGGCKNGSEFTFQHCCHEVHDSLPGHVKQLVRHICDGMKGVDECLAIAADVPLRIGKSGAISVFLKWLRKRSHIRAYIST